MSNRLQFIHSKATGDVVITRSQLLQWTDGCATNAQFAILLPLIDEDPKRAPVKGWNERIIGTVVSAEMAEEIKLARNIFRPRVSGVNKNPNKWKKKNRKQGKR